MNRINQTIAEQICPEMLELISTQPSLVVSGQPLRLFDIINPEKDRFLEDCEPLVDELIFAPFNLFLQKVPAVGHSNHPEEFLSDEGYPALSGFVLSGDEVVMGIRDALGFKLKAEM